MKFLIVMIFLYAFVHSKVSGDVLECYVCDDQDCNSIDTMRIDQCHSTATTTTKPTTIEPSTGSTLPDSTPIDCTTTDAVPTTDDSTNTDATKTTESLTDPATTTTTIITTTTVPSTVEQTTPVPSTIPSTTESAITTTIATTVEITTTEVASPPPPPKPLAPLTLRNYHNLLRTRRAVGADGTSYACYTVEYKDKETSASRIQKGCVEIPVENSACSTVEGQLGVKSEKCTVCTENKCNSSATIKISILTMALLAYIRYLM